MNSENYSIKIAARKTGLTPHLIRAWEKRYEAVSPERAANNHRLYSPVEIERLALLRRATHRGLSISQAARMPSERIIELLKNEGDSANLETEAIAEKTDFYPSCIAAAERFDAEELERLLSEATVELGKIGIIETVITPIMERIGERCRLGTLRIAHEHLASAVIRNFLGNLRSSIKTENRAPRIVIATPAGQLHDIGAIVAALIAASQGWRVTYLGANLPAEEIAVAVIKTKAKAAALSIVYPEDDWRLDSELRTLRQCLGNGISLFAGGRGARSYSGALEEINAIYTDGIENFKLGLENLRKF
ncbi:MAG: MerR family transcriptional regulator [Deltaproteobacteria bacterium]